MDFIDENGQVYSELSSARQLDEVFASSSGLDPQKLDQMSHRLILLGDLDFIVRVGKTIDGNTNFSIEEQIE